jgi:RimJ/RimL family protein N-acetyltransferase
LSGTALEEYACRCGRLLGTHRARGVELRIRIACRKDRDALIRFYESLSLETIYTRFFGIIRYFDPYVDKLLSNARAVVVVAEAPDGRIVGVAEAVGDESGNAESGIAVLEEFRGMGVGTALARAIVRVSRECGFRKLYGYVLANNTAAYRLATKFGARLVGSYESMYRIEIDLD